MKLFWSRFAAVICHSLTWCLTLACSVLALLAWVVVGLLTIAFVVFAVRAAIWFWPEYGPVGTVAVLAFAFVLEQALERSEQQYIHDQRPVRRI